MHVFLLVDTVEYGARNVADAFGNNPPDCGGGYGVYQRFEGNQYRHWLYQRVPVYPSISGCHPICRASPLEPAMCNNSKRGYPDHGM